MRDVAIIAIGQTPVNEHWESSLRMLAADAIHAALNEVQRKQVDALYVGNAYGSTFSSQSQLGTLVADYAGLTGIEAYTIEAGDASGGAALRTGYLAVASGAVETALVVGVEKSTDTVGSHRVQARNISLDADYEAIHGATLPALAALLMRRYMHENNLDLSAFEGFSINAHANGKRNANAMFRNTLRQGTFLKAPMVADPVSLFDSAPDGDGAAAVILTSAERAADLVPQPVRITGSAVATDTLTLHDREDPLYLNAVNLSTQKAMLQAGISIKDIDLFELHDAFTILTTLILEAAGFAERGEGWRFAQESTIGLNGSLPISTFGGLKSRGNPAGATGVYQAVEACLQLRNQAGENQVPDAQTALIQNLGGLGSTVVTHVLQI
ncbi:MAG: thiolase domain-containing protein [Chloroflexi bacterium]|nr:MAG: acetyl-CoA acetyltransferase [Phototrophicales bacterium]RMF80088.1 MAG: thiolase domain-containing protein [Chloroflexota bacterium]